MTPLVLRFLHILAAALWLGSALFWPGGVRRALALGGPPVAPALAQARVALGLDLGAGLATIATGALLVVVAGAHQLTVAAGLLVALLRLALLLALARPAVARAGAAASAGDLERARAAARKIPAYAGIAHLLWAVALAAMVFPA